MPDVTLKNISSLLEESIRLERGIGDIYFLFAQIYPEDEKFWTQLAAEEDKHANVLEGLRPWLAMGVDVDPLLLPDLKELKHRNRAIRKVFAEARKHTPSKEIAYNAAYHEPDGITPLPLFAYAAVAYYRKELNIPAASERKENEKKKENK